MPRKIPKIIHCIWIGGGDITKVKSLAGIESWLEETDYDVWVWWDDAHVFSAETRKEMSKGKDKDSSPRQVFDTSVEKGSPLRNSAAPGMDIHNVRFLTREAESPDEKLRKTVTSSTVPKPRFNRSAIWWVGAVAGSRCATSGSTSSCPARWIG